jgi:hypothetical protein
MSLLNRPNSEITEYELDNWDLIAGRRGLSCFLCGPGTGRGFFPKEQIYRNVMLHLRLLVKFGIYGALFRNPIRLCDVTLKLGVIASVTFITVMEKIDNSVKLSVCKYYAFCPREKECMGSARLLIMF